MDANLQTIMINTIIERKILIRRKHCYFEALNILFILHLSNQFYLKPLLFLLFSLSYSFVKFKQA
jgi:hypothetical protein